MKIMSAKRSYSASFSIIEAQEESLAKINREKAYNFF